MDWIRDEAYRIRCTQRAQEIQQQLRQDVHNTFVMQSKWVDDDAHIFYDDYEIPGRDRFVRRSKAEAAIKQRGFDYTQQSYALSKEAAALLREFDIRGPYHTCYGNQLQQVIHQECVDLLERTAQLQPESPIFEYQESLVYFIEAAHIDNKVGRTHNASIIADFCYTLLDYGKAVLEGARDGLVGVAQYALNDPLRTIASTTLSVAAGEYLLAYQLGKIAYKVLNLTIIAAIDRDKAKQTWDGYITPISNLIDTLKNKQISLHDGIRAGTALAVSMKAQSILAKGCEKLYAVAKTRALEYIAKNPLPSLDQYMTTPDGIMFSVTTKSANPTNTSLNNTINRNVSGSPCSSQIGPHKNVKILWDIKDGNTGEVRYHFGGDIRKLYRDPSRKYWWVKDTEAHGGSILKVFIQDGKSFKWVYDSDTFGNFIKNKHKGQTGMFIHPSQIISTTYK